MALVAFLVGLLVGGYLFSRSQPRSFLSLQSCTRCLSRAELQGLVASVVVNRMPAAAEPLVVFETDRTVAIKSPEPERRIDYLVLPKKDIKNIGELADADRAYLDDAFAVIQHLIESDHLADYDVITYGPGQQKATYLHFHLRSAT
ncbi:MAG: histidine triad family protein [Chloroflexota bacterium]|nr:histidine triad family protein [Chloroflexota bacterium]